MNEIDALLAEWASRDQLGDAEIESIRRNVLDRSREAELLALELARALAGVRLAVHENVQRETRFLRETLARLATPA